MRIVVHDYSGHPFQVQLSRALAAAGHEVTHLYARFFQTPHGTLTRLPGDPAGFRVEALDIAEPFAKYSFVRRVRQEREYGHVVARRIAEIAPNVVLSSNMPLDPQAILQRACRARGIRFVFWLQDIYSVAIDRVMRRRLPLAGALIGLRYRLLEARLLRRSDAVVAITDDFRPLLERWGVRRDRITMIENWAPLDEMPLKPRDNDWAREHGLIGRKVILYAGTLGLKHDPSLLLALARRFADDPAARVVVISEGPGADWLASHRDPRLVDKLMVLPFQPFERLPEVLASADVLTAILEPDAGVYSVPSKVLTYLCAGRPIIAAMPSNNLAARVLARSGAGIVTPPGDGAAMAEAAAALLGDQERCQRLGADGRDFATQHFQIDAIARRFDPLLDESGRVELIPVTA